MSLYGALFTGVSGLSSQGQKIAVISDNISNVNTVGYKRAEETFSTLVVNSSLASAYSPGGARGLTRYHIEQQGLLTTTAAPTDIAISGQGFYVVSANPDGSGQNLYTRAGSFRQDADGNFYNAQGFFLKAWPLDKNGLLPGEPGNLNTTSFSNVDSLQVVNVEELSGEATATTSLALGMNLDAGEEVYPGESVTADMDSNTLSLNNYEINADAIIAPDEASTVVPPANFGLATANNLARGDRFTISTGEGLEYDYTYGGFTIGRDIDISGTNNIGDGGTDLTPLTLAAGSVTTDGATNVVTVTTAAAHGLSTGDQIRIAGFTYDPAGGTDTIPLSEINRIHTITVTGANTFTVTTTTLSTLADTNLAGATYTTRLFGGNILDADNASEPLIDPTNLGNYTVNARSFTITTTSFGPYTFTYTTSSPSAAAGQFNSLNTLAAAIDAQAGLNARVVDGRLMVGAADATEAVTFANVDATGVGTLAGIDWTTELDLQNVAAGARRFSTLRGLGTLINADSGVSATLNDAPDGATLKINVDNPLDTIRLQDYQSDPVDVGAGNLTVTVAGVLDTVQITYPGHGLSVGDNIVLSNFSDFGGVLATEINGNTYTVTNVVSANVFEIQIASAGAAVADANIDGQFSYTNVGSVLAELGIVDSLAGAAYTRGDTGALGPQYDSSGVTGDNMASGEIQPQFSKSVRVYDSLGTGHDINFSFIKIANNQWAVEAYASNPTEISTTLTDGQIAVGIIEFNGDGSLASLTSGLVGALRVNWTNGAEPSDITLDLGTAGVPFGTPGVTNYGDTNGMRQFDGDYQTIFVDQNGSPVGDLVSINIDEDGFIIASYTNGEQEKLYKIPIADFVNPNGLQPITGNVYAETNESGDLILREAGTGGAGDIVSGALEQSNVDLAQELTDLIVAQRAYQSNTRVISTSDELLEQLTQL